MVDFETNFYVSDIEVDEEVNVINEASEMVASVVAPRVDRIESEGEEGEETETEVVGEEAKESFCAERPTTSLRTDQRDGSCPENLEQPAEHRARFRDTHVSGEFSAIVSDLLLGINL